jgi:4a-hydroxytetrahydrobiopterin dehydratase
MAKLGEPEIQTHLANAKGWDRLGDMLVRTWHFASGRRALEFVTMVTGIAEREDHYPDIILSHRSVRVELSSHAEGGLTSNDFQIAAEIGMLPTDR